MKSVFKRNKDQFGPFCTNLNHKSQYVILYFSHFCKIFELVDLRAFLPRPPPPPGFLPLPRPAPPRGIKGRPAHPWFVITFWDFNRCNFVICRYDNACHFYFNLPQKISITSTKDLSAKKFKKNLSECLSFNIIIACLQAGITCGHASATWWAEQGPCEPMSAWESQSKPD